MIMGKASARENRTGAAPACPAVAAGMLAALLLAAPLATAAETPPGRIAVLAQAGADGDADDLDSLLLRGGALFGYRSHLQHAGFAAQNTHYAEGAWTLDVPGLVGIYRSQRPDTLEGVRAEAGLVSVSGRARFVGDATWSHRPRDSTGVELIAAGDVVGTRAALERGIAYGLAAASVEQQFGERLTAIALAGWQPFTDGNSRALLRARLIWSVLPEEGFSAQLRWRQYSSSKDDVQGAYFNPDHYRNWDAVLSLRRRVGTWRLAGLAGAGQERAGNASWQTTSIAELRAEGPLSGEMRLAFNFLYSRAAGFAATPDYWYTSAGVNLIVPMSR